MYLAELGISNFRKISAATLRFQPGLNVLVGANNAGKTAVIDALRSLLAGLDEPYPRLDSDDVHRPKGALLPATLSLPMYSKAWTWMTRPISCQLSALAPTVAWRRASPSASDRLTRLDACVQSAGAGIMKTSL
ncbi:AAA family ATPase [Stenotrophomonas sp. CD2]|nr:AAA family ATPase [Stenotrophomonas sp. CD2]